MRQRITDKRHFFENHYGAQITAGKPHRDTYYYADSNASVMDFTVFLAYLFSVDQLLCVRIHNLF